jgi:Methylamine utilisation protein MauE
VLPAARTKGRGTRTYKLAGRSGIRAKSGHRRKLDVAVQFYRRRNDVSTSTDISGRLRSIWAPSRKRADRWFTVVRVLLGLLLLTAAGLKLYGLNVTALPRLGWFSAPRVQVAAAAWEVLLGLWLLSGACRGGAWLATVGTFAVFGVVSAYLGWTGEATCACLGAVRASPWLAFAVDATALAALTIYRPSLSRQAFELPPRLASGILVSAAALFALAGLSSWIYGSSESALARLRGEVLSAAPEYLQLGEGVPGQVLFAAVNVRNWSDQPVRLIGGSSDCSCVTTTDLPLTVPPGESRAVTVALKIPRAGRGSLSRAAEIWTDQPKQRTIRLALCCQVLD